MKATTKVIDDRTQFEEMPYAIKTRQEGAEKSIIVQENEDAMNLTTGTDGVITSNGQENENLIYEAMARQSEGSYERAKDDVIHSDKNMFTSLDVDTTEEVVGPVYSSDE
jgi:hypothetical protein